MIVGIDVHKHSHAAALLDERGGEIATLTFANSPKGYQRLLSWLAGHGAEEAVVGVESPGSYGRCLVAALVAAGHETLQVPAWRTHRERHRQGPGKTDPGDAISIAQVVLRKRRELGPALEPEIVRTLGLLELQRRRLVRDRTQTIQRLRADWTQFDPVSEARVIRCDRQRELAKLKRLSGQAHCRSLHPRACSRRRGPQQADQGTRRRDRRAAGGARQPARFIQTLQREWAYAHRWQSSTEWLRSLSSFLRYYNRRRPHSSLGDRPPIRRVHNVRG